MDPAFWFIAVIIGIVIGLGVAGLYFVYVFKDFMG